MKADRNLLSGIIFGAVRTEERNGWFRPCRFSKKQTDYFKRKPGYTMRAYAASGIHMDFWTDAEAFSFSYKTFWGSSQTIHFIDVYVDDVLQIHQGSSKSAVSSGRIQLNMKPGRKHVMIYFPCLSRIKISDVEIDEYTLFEPAKKEKKLLFLGDSITQGYITDYPSLTYTNILTRKLRAESVNQAIGGAVFDAGDLDETLGFDPDMIFVAYGTNDWYHRRDIAHVAGTYLKKLTGIYPNTPVYVILPIWRSDTGEQEASGAIPFEEARQTLRKVCELYANVSVIDGIDFVPHCAEFFADGYLHPNEEGFKLYADRLEAALEGR